MSKELTGLGRTIVTTDKDEMKLDRCVKNVLAYKPILARIFKETVTECHDMNFTEIERCIEGDIQIDIVGLNPGTTNVSEDVSKISGNTQEDAENGEGLVKYDIRTTLRIPDGNTVGVKLLIDVEAQKDDTPGYDISERAIFHTCRMISSQLSAEFTNSTADKVKYGNLKKVYSIWICTETAQKRANTIERYNIQKCVYPKEKEGMDSRYDLMEAVIVNISAKHNTEDSKSELICMLTDLFNENIDSKEKVDLLKKRYSLPTTVEFEREVHDMTMYTANIEKKGYSMGFDNGFADGFEKFAFLAIQEGRYSVEEVAEKLNMTTREVLEKMEAAGYKVPVEV